MQKKIIFRKRLDRRNTFFKILRNLIGKGCFQITLDARQSPEDSL